MADIKEIKVNDTGFSGYIAKFNTNCMSISDIDWPLTCVPSNEGETGCTCEWVSFSFETNKINAKVDPNDTGEQRECVFEIKYKTSESTGCTKQFKIVQGSVTPEPPGPEPDPKPLSCVTPTDNCYWEENPNKSVPDTCINQWKTPNNHWWSGPIDDGTTNGDDRGLDTAGDISEGDTIRIAFTGNTGGQFVTTFTSSTFSAIVDSNCSSWLSFRITNDTIMPGGHGQINYKVTENTGECRQGFVKLYTDGSATDHEWEGNPIGTPFCLGPSPVWVMQTGSGSGPTPSSCICKIGSEFVYPTYYDSTGSTEPVKIGTITYVEGCSGPTTFKEITITHGSSTIWSGADDFDIRPTSDTTADVYATVPENTDGVERSVHVYFNCMQHDDHTQFDYLNFYQEAGEPGPSSECPEITVTKSYHIPGSGFTNGTIYEIETDREATLTAIPSSTDTWLEDMNITSEGTGTNKYKITTTVGPTSEERTGWFHIKCNGNECEIHAITQDECTCDVANFSITGNSEVNGFASNAVIGKYTANCIPPNPTFSHSSGDEIIDISGGYTVGEVEGRKVIYMNVTENSSTKLRTETFKICNHAFTIHQNLSLEAVITNNRTEPIRNVKVKFNLKARDGETPQGYTSQEITIPEMGAGETITQKFSESRVLADENTIESLTVNGVIAVKENVTLSNFNRQVSFGIKKGI